MTSMYGYTLSNLVGKPSFLEINFSYEFEIPVIKFLNLWDS